MADSYRVHYNVRGSGRDIEQKGQPGSSLAWFLKAQSEYPAVSLPGRDSSDLPSRFCLMATS